MKNLLYAILLVLIVSACNDTEVNSPAFQANLENNLYRTNGTSGTYDPVSNYFTVFGLTGDESMELKFKYPPADTMYFGPGLLNTATFEDYMGNVYTTDVEGGSGAVVITDLVSSSKKLSGNFRFTAVLPGIDTITVSNGLFFRVPYVTEEDPDGGDGTLPVGGTFLALVDGDQFNPETVTAVTDATSIVIAGGIGAETITVIVPLDVEPGNYVITDSGFNGIYNDGTINEEAIEGSVVIVEHDTAARTIKGTFSFNTDSKSISLGQFNVDY